MKKQYKQYSIAERLEYHSSKILQLEDEITFRKERIKELEALQGNKIWNRELTKIAKRKAGK